MVTVHMLVGIPGSGKTSYARKLKKEYNYDIISTDAIRDLHPSWPETDIWPEVYRLCAELISQGKDFIFDATNTTPKVRQRFRDKLEPYGVSYQVGVYYFKTPANICYERIEKRNLDPKERYFPLDKVDFYQDLLIPPSLDEGFCFIKIIE